MALWIVCTPYMIFETRQYSVLKSPGLRELIEAMVMWREGLRFIVFSSFFLVFTSMCFSFCSFPLCTQYQLLCMA